MLVATRALRGHYHEALEVLAELQPSDVVFPVSKFRAHAASALILADSGDSAAAKEHASQAIAAAEANHSGLRNHSRLGLVGSHYDSLRKRLAKLAQS